MMKPALMLKLVHACWLVAVIAVLSGCDDAGSCDIPGAAGPCACAPGAAGARVCSAEHTWGACNCSGAIPLPNPVVDVGGSGGSGGTTGSGGSAGVGGGGSGGSGGGTPPDDGGNGDDDGGTDMPDGGGAGGMNGGSGGSGAMGGTGGTGPENPYGPCAGNVDCAPIGDCTITPNFPNDASVCAPHCTETSDCPVPAGMYDAVVMCVTGYCRIDCTSVAFQPLRSCPSGMACVAPLFGTPWCHDDGM